MIFGFLTLLKVTIDSAERLGAEFFDTHNFVVPVIGEQDYANTREITCRYLLEPGNYVLVPSTFDSDVNAAYLLRMYAWTPKFDCK